MKYAVVLRVDPLQSTKRTDVFGVKLLGISVGYVLQSYKKLGTRATIARLRSECTQS